MKKYILVVALVLFLGGCSFAQQTTPSPLPLPKVTIGIEQSSKPQDVAVTLQILFLMTILSLAPAILIMTTAFTRIIVVLHFLKQALGTQQMPPSQVLVGLALFLTFFVMAPTWKEVNDHALQPYLKNEISMDTAYNRAIEPIRNFMFRQTREEDIALFVKIANLEKPKNHNDIPTYVLIPAFAISELRIGFQIGFLIFIPFLMIDMIVSSILMSLGMMMLPPVLVSLPFKILLFILIDGWYLLVSSLIQSFH